MSKKTGHRQATRPLAFFDLDGTLLPHDTFFLFANFLIRRSPWRLYYLIPFMLTLPFFLMRWVGPLRLKQSFLTILWRISEAELAAICRAFVERSVLPHIYPEMRTEIERLRTAGYALILNTASPDFYAQEIGRALGFDKTFGTRFHVSPRMPFWQSAAGPNNSTWQKIHSMHAVGLLPGLDALSIESGIPAPIPRSSTYTDSTKDLPLLQLAARGFVVHPGERLAELAATHDWTIMHPEPSDGKMPGPGAPIKQLLGLFSI
ncbi:MAG: haloacid dehalogenase-like hydrolase [Leptospiraceae bacterium]|nr:haloacid dehalogenase-like hydrolase [Leptospiraceae bacterium]